MQTSLRGRQPGVYRLRQLKAKDPRGVTHVNLPEISLEVKNTSGVVKESPSAATVQQPDQDGAEHSRIAQAYERLKSAC